MKSRDCISDQKPTSSGKLDFKEYEETIALNQLLLEFTSKGLSLLDSELDCELTSILGRISAICSHIDRSYVFLYDADPTANAMSNTHEWCAEGVSPAIDQLQGLPCDMAPWWMDKLSRHELIVLSSLEDLPPEAFNERALIESQGIQSLIIVPIFFRDVLRGFVGFDSVRSIRIWSNHEQSVLTAFAAALALLLERRETTQRLRSSESSLRFVVENLSGAVFSADPEGHLTLVKGRLASLFESKEKNQPTIDEMFTAVPVAREAFRTALSGLSASVAFPFESHFLELNMAPIMEAEQFKGIVGMLSDITEYEHTRSQLALSARWASIGVLASGIAHEINNPLAIVMGFSYVLEQNLKELKDADKFLPIIDKQNSAIQRVVRIIESLRVFADGFEAPMAVEDLNAIVIDSLPLCEAMFDRAGIRLELDCSPGVILVTSNRAQFQHIILTLLSNARDAVSKIDEAHILIRTKIESAHAWLIVEDNGHGIDPESIENIFDPFFTAKEIGQGTGLGLSVAKSLLLSMQGEITVKSKVGVGSSFVVKLPCLAAGDLK